MSISLLTVIYLRIFINFTNVDQRRKVGRYIKIKSKKSNERITWKSKRVYKGSVQIENKCYRRKSNTKYISSFSSSSLFLHLLLLIHLIDYDIRVSSVRNKYTQRNLLSERTRFRI